MVADTATFRPYLPICLPRARDTTEVSPAQLGASLDRRVAMARTATDIRVSNTISAGLAFRLGSARRATPAVHRLDSAVACRYVVTFHIFHSLYSKRIWSDHGA